MKIQGVKSIMKKVPYIDLSNNRKNNLVFFVAVDPSDTNKGKISSDICRHFPIISNKVNRYIYVIYVYDLNEILTTPMKKRSDK